MRGRVNWEPVSKLTSGLYQKQHVMTFVAFKPLWSFRLFDNRYGSLKKARAFPKLFGMVISNGFWFPGLGHLSVMHTDNKHVCVTHMEKLLIYTSSLCLNTQGLSLGRVCCPTYNSKDKIPVTILYTLRPVSVTKETFLTASPRAEVYQRSSPILQLSGALSHPMRKAPLLALYPASEAELVASQLLPEVGEILLARSNFY